MTYDCISWDYNKRALSAYSEVWTISGTYFEVDGILVRDKNYYVLSVKYIYKDKIIRAYYLMLQRSHVLIWLIFYLFDWLRKLVSFSWRDISSTLS